MKRVILAALLSVPFLLAACGEDEAATNTKSTPVTANDVKKQASEAVGAATDYAQQQQKEFVANSQKELDQIESQLAEWRAKAKNAGADAKGAMEAKLDRLERDRQAAADKLSELKASTADAWGDVKAGFQNAMDKLRDAYEKAKQDFA
jgi:flagellar motility protein MotE (MotC chaperone)